MFYVYNPSVHEQEFVTFTVPYSTFTIQLFNKPTMNFQTLITSSQEVDTFCTDGPDKTPECEVYIHRQVPPLSDILLLVTYSSQPVFETKIYSFGFDVRPALLAFETPEV